MRVVAQSHKEGKKRIIEGCSPKAAFSKTEPLTGCAPLCCILPYVCFHFNKSITFANYQLWPTRKQSVVKILPKLRQKKRELKHNFFIQGRMKFSHIFAHKKTERKKIYENSFKNLKILAPCKMEVIADVLYVSMKVRNGVFSFIAFNT